MFLKKKSSLRSAKCLHTLTFENSPFVYKTPQISLFWVCRLFPIEILIDQGSQTMISKF